MGVFLCISMAPWFYLFSAPKIQFYKVFIATGWAPPISIYMARFSWRQVGEGGIFLFTRARVWRWKIPRSLPNAMRVCMVYEDSGRLCARLYERRIFSLNFHGLTSHLVGYNKSYSFKLRREWTFSLWLVESIINMYRVNVTRFLSTTNWNFFHIFPRHLNAFSLNTIAKWNSF